MQNQQLPKQIAKATMEGTAKRRTPSKRRKDKGDKDINIMVPKGWAMVRDHQEWRKTVLDAKAHNGL
jgi:hypothetical protein